MPTPRRTAAALRYGKDEGAGAPLLVASGRGPVADAIVAAAREAGVPIHEDRLLAEALSGLELGAEVPPALYQAVAETLIWAYALARRGPFKS
ncbi:MAG TPA: EscU/YscU/HrcU family type III secretion system export apparatus switch protein [Gaiellales bacterium]|jgi:flagellar biosynthesis protein|nr:EscU/YscU/HrcU family type III secretion system export apparatus switch protein [Gaiellales bacterium]